MMMSASSDLSNCFSGQVRAVGVQRSWLVMGGGSVYVSTCGWRASRPRLLQTDRPRRGALLSELGR